MSRLVFQPSDVRRVVEHSLAAPKQREVWTDYDAKTRKSTYEPVKAPAVVLVHDDGVYLMSNGDPRDIRDGGEDTLGARSFCAYAKGCDPKDDGCWDRSRALVGGDDFAETLPWAREIKTVIDQGAKQIILTFHNHNISLSWR